MPQGHTVQTNIMTRKKKKNLTPLDVPLYTA